MSAFENFLVEQGYKIHAYDFKQQKNIPFEGRPFFSTNGTLDYRYIKNGMPVFIYGLNEAGRGPTLISPRPLAEHGGKAVRLYGDALMGRMFERYTNKEIYEAALHKSALQIDPAGFEYLFDFNLFVSSAASTPESPLSA